MGGIRDELLLGPFFFPFDGGRTEEIEYEWLEC